MARDVLLRILQLGLMVGGGIAVLLVAGARLLPSIFTSDPAVINAAARVLPLMALYMVRCSACQVAAVMRGCGLLPQRLLCVPFRHGHLHSFAPGWLQQYPPPFSGGKCVQPLDACASILDGGLIGASENAYMGKTMIVTAAVCSAALLCVRQLPGAGRAS